jgi:hypothetical protein
VGQAPVDQPVYSTTPCTPSAASAGPGAAPFLSAAQPAPAGAEHKVFSFPGSLCLLFLLDMLCHGVDFCFGCTHVWLCVMSNVCRVPLNVMSNFGRVLCDEYCLPYTYTCDE